MRRAIAKAQLYLNGKDVGCVAIQGWEGAWGFGEFKPNETFSRFATIFGCWSLLMHADYDRTQLSDEALEELRRVEYAIDALRARLFLPDVQEWRDIQQVNIDAGLIEWKE